MKKYMLFQGTIFYPSGGWEDFKGYFSTLQEAKEEAKKEDAYCSWAHIVYEDKIILFGSGIQKGENYNDEEWTWRTEE